MTDVILRVIDVETTGLAPPAEVIEVGWQDVLILGESAPTLGQCGSKLFGAANGIPPETMAVHHITPPMIEGLPEVTAADLRCGPLSPTAFVAHNADFEGQWYTADALGETPLACTYKAALRVWPDAPSHSNSCLRYWRGLLDLPEDRAMPPHRAGPDAFVTAHLLIELLAAGMTLDHLLAWSRAPKLYPKVNFGKHRGAKWADVPDGYLKWMGDQADMEMDAKWCAARELKRRAA